MWIHVIQHYSFFPPEPLFSRFRSERQTPPLQAGPCIHSGEIRKYNSVYADPKAASLDGRHYVFVLPSDALAFQYYTDIAARRPDWKMEVVRLPDPVTPTYVRNVDGYHGILSLALRKSNGKITAVPFVVPGGRFNEVYGWDRDVANTIATNFGGKLTTPDRQTETTSDWNRRADPQGPAVA